MPFDLNAGQAGEQTRCWVGIDISKEWIDVAVLHERGSETMRCDRNSREMAKLAKQLARRVPGRVVLEATGGLEREVIAALAGLPVVRVNPQRAREFARAQGLLAKTDRLDAEVLARFGECLRPPCRALPDAEQQRLMQLQRRYEQLTEMRAVEQLRLQQTADETVRASSERVRALLDQERDRVEQELAACVAGSEMFRSKAALLESAPGVGPKTARVLLAAMPELGELNRRECAALAGLAPFAQDSGQWRGKRSIRGGRSQVRRALYLAAWSSARVAAGFRDYYQQLVARGKPRQVAMIAVARKLLVALNQMLASGQRWRSKQLTA